MNINQLRKKVVKHCLVCNKLTGGLIYKKYCSNACKCKAYRERKKGCV